MIILKKLKYLKEKKYINLAINTLEGDILISRTEKISNNIKNNKEICLYYFRRKRNNLLSRTRFIKKLNL